MDNYVDITVRAADNSKLDLTALKARLDELGRKVETARVDLAGDKEAQASLARLEAKLLGWGRRTATAKLKVDGVARAEADILGVGLSLDRLGAKSEDVSAGPLRRLSGALGGLVTGTSDVIGVVGGSGGLTAVLGAGVAAAAAVALIALTPLIASLALVTAGIAGFAAVAVPMIGKVITARTQLQAAEAKYDAATTKAQRAAALKAEAAATAGLTEAQKRLLGPMDQIAAQFRKLTKAVEPQITRAFGESLKIIKDLMPAFTPLVKAAGKALDGLLKNIDEWLKSDSGKKFIHWMEFEGPKAIAAFGRALWRIITIFGDVVHFMYDEGRTMDRQIRRNIHSVASAIDQLRETWVAVGHAIEASWNWLAGRARALWNAIVGTVRGAVHGVESAWSGVEHALVAPVEAAYHQILAWVHDIENALGAIPGAVAHALGGIPGKVLGVLGALNPFGGPMAPVSGGPAVPGGSLSASVLAGPGSVSAGPLARPHRAPWYGHERITNQFVPYGPQPQRPVRITNGAELIAILADLLREHSRTHYGGSAQRAYGYGPG